MLTENAFDVIAVLALIAVIHAIVTTLIARKLTRDERAAEAASKTGSASFDRAAANDGFRRAA